MTVVVVMTKDIIWTEPNHKQSIMEKFKSLTKQKKYVTN